MASVLWHLRNDRPVIEVELPLHVDARNLVRRIVADTGAGSNTSPFQIVLHEDDCLLSGGIPMGHVQLAGAYAGAFPVYLVEVSIPQLSFGEPVPAVGVKQVPAGFDGIAGFRFLNRFHYGNFGVVDSFGLEQLP